MSYGLAVNNDKGYKVFDSNELPYIFTVINEPMVEVNSTYWHRYVYDIHDRFTESILVAIDTNYDGYNYKVDLYNGRWHIILTREGDDYFTSRITLPRVYVMDRLPSKAATGYGIECRNELGEITLSSSTPLPQIVGTYVVTTTRMSWDKHYTTVGTLGDNLLVIESSRGESVSGYQNLYPGGGLTHVVSGKFTDWRVRNGQIQVCDGSYESESGEGTDYFTSATPVRFTLVKRP